MFIQAHQDYKCSRCSALNRNEFVFRDNKSFIRCTSCGHELQTSETTTSGIQDGETLVYTIEPLPDVIDF